MNFNKMRFILLLLSALVYLSVSLDGRACAFDSLRYEFFRNQGQSGWSQKEAFEMIRKNLNNVDQIRYPEAAWVIHKMFGRHIELMRVFQRFVENNILPDLSGKYKAEIQHLPKMIENYRMILETEFSHFKTESFVRLADYFQYLDSLIKFPEFNPQQKEIESYLKTVEGVGSLIMLRIFRAMLPPDEAKQRLDDFFQLERQEAFFLTTKLFNYAVNMWNLNRASDSKKPVIITNLDDVDGFIRFFSHFGMWDIPYDIPLRSFETHGMPAFGRIGFQGQTADDVSQFFRQIIRFFPEENRARATETLASVVKAPNEPLPVKIYRAMRELSEIWNAREPDASRHILISDLHKKGGMEKAFRAIGVLNWTSDISQGVYKRFAEAAPRVIGRLKESFCPDATVREFLLEHVRPRLNDEARPAFDTAYDRHLSEQTLNQKRITSDMERNKELYHFVYDMCREWNLAMPDREIDLERLRFHEGLTDALSVFGIWNRRFDIQIAEYELFARSGFDLLDQLKSVISSPSASIGEFFGDHLRVWMPFAYQKDFDVLLSRMDSRELNAPDFASMKNKALFVEDVFWLMNDLISDILTIFDGRQSIISPQNLSRLNDAAWANQLSRAGLWHRAYELSPENLREFVDSGLPIIREFSGAAIEAEAGIRAHIEAAIVSRYPDDIKTAALGVLDRLGPNDDVRGLTYDGYDAHPEARAIYRVLYDIVKLWNDHHADIRSGYRISVDNLYTDDGIFRVLEKIEDYTNPVIRQSEPSQAPRASRVRQRPPSVRYEMPVQASPSRQVSMDEFGAGGLLELAKVGGDSNQFNTNIVGFFQSHVLSRLSADYLEASLIARAREIVLTLDQKDGQLAFSKESGASDARAKIYDVLHKLGEIWNEAPDTAKVNLEHAHTSEGARVALRTMLGGTLVIEENPRYRAKVPAEILSLYDQWKDVVEFQGYLEMSQMNSYQSKKLDSSDRYSVRLNLNWRVVYEFIDNKIFVISITDHDTYERNW